MIIYLHLKQDSQVLFMTGKQKRIDRSNVICPLMSKSIL